MAASGVTIEVECEDGRPVEVLQDLIEARVRILRQTTRDAVIATAITVLKSLRALTRKGKATIKVDAEAGEKLSVTVELENALRVGFTGHDHKVCVRDAAGNRRPEIRPWLRVAPSELSASHVYKVTLSGDRVEAWPYQRRVTYMVARSLDSARKIVQERFSKVAVKSSGLAKDALSRAMQLASSKPATLVSKRAAILSERNLVQVEKRSSGIDSGSFEIEVCDRLDYAAEALKGGAGALDVALAKASNSITGYLNNYMTKHATTFFKESDMLETPFTSDYFDPNT